MDAVVSNSKVISIREAQRRAPQARNRSRKAEQRPATGFTEWLNAKASNGTVLMVAAFTVVLVLIIFAALSGAPAPMPLTE